MNSNTWKFFLIAELSRCFFGSATTYQANLARQFVKEVLDKSDAPKHISYSGIEDINNLSYKMLEDIVQNHVTESKAMVMVAELAPTERKFESYLEQIKAHGEPQ